MLRPKPKVRRPKGFWKEGGFGHDLIVRHLRGEITEDEAAEELRRESERLNVDIGSHLMGTPSPLHADVRWYAREFRKTLEVAGSGETAPERGGPPATERLVLGQGGRVVIPAAYRDALGLKEGDEVTLWLDVDAVHVIPTARVLKRAQALVRRYIPAGRSLVDELIAERRREADRE